MSETSNPQFDSYVGGSESVPNAVNVSEFIKNRMEEVVMLTETIKESPFRGQTFQRLPKHMRRRQMSHHVKRLPRKLQRPYLLSLKESLPAPPKCPSRKYRRRPSNLLKEYNRRQKHHTWLETHIWHAKRFHMVEKWGYKLPHYPTNKSFKACYRAVSEHCLLTDMSYYSCIELSGPEEKILEGLKQCTSSDCGLTFCAKIYINGMREGCVTLFKPNLYPSGVIGNVKFMWQPKCTNNRKIWIWVHPLMHEEIVECFVQLFNLVAENVTNHKAENISEKNTEEEKFKKQKKRKKIREKAELIKLIPKNVPFIQTPKYKSKEVTMSLLKDTLNRFKLTGPMAQPIISQAFTVISVSPEKKSDVEIIEVPKKKIKLDEEEIIEVVDNLVEEGWWVKFYENDDFKKSWTLQKEFYGRLSECVKPSDVPPEMILSLVVEDPRLRIPSKREKALPCGKDLQQTLTNSISSSLSLGPIWDPEVRDKVSMTKLSTYEINTKRSMKIIPGSDVVDIIPDSKQSRIPILLVQTPGRSDNDLGKLGLGSSWDVIAPANFGMPIWLSLNFRGGRAGGLRESDLMDFECNNFKTCLQPDSAAGEAESQMKFQELRKRYFELPPNKRPNFTKLGVPSPFYPLWKILVKDWIIKTNPKTTLEKAEVSVLRNKKSLSELSEFVEKFSQPSKIEYNKFLNLNCNYLIPVVIESIGKGNPTDLALICLPSQQDIKNYTASKVEPKEPIHSDENEKLRKVLKLEHFKLLKSLRRKRKKEKSKLRDNFSNNKSNDSKYNEIKSITVSSKPHSDAYNTKMRSLWVPDLDTIKSIIHSGSRELLGYVTKGGFSMSRSCGFAMGYVSLFGLLEAFKVCKGNKLGLLVLVRNNNQMQYRFGRLKIPVQ